MVLKTFPSATKYLKTIVSFGKVTPEQKEEVEKFGLAIYAWDEFLLLLAQEGDDKQYDLPVKKKSDICTIMYTSGTTGDPKGVLISNNSIVTLIAGVRCLLGSVHELCFINIGGSIGFWRGDVKLLTEDIGELKPTIFCAVPRVLDRIYAEFATEDLIWGSLKKYYVQLRRLIVYGLIISTDWVCKGFHDPRKWLLSAQDGTQASNVNVQEADPKEVTYAERLTKIKGILSGETSIQSDLLILKTIKQSVEPRNSVCHSATIYANAIMHAGTTVDTFLCENLHSKAVNFVRNQLRQHRDVQLDRRLQDNVSIIIVDLGKLHNMKKGSKHVDAAPLCDKIVFNKVKHGLGRNVQLILSGAAPLATHVEAFLRVVACCHVLQGYGLTESCAGTFVSLPNELGMLGTVGPPVPNVDVCLESIPEMGYDALSSTPRGEICIRGDTLFSGYHKREDLTKEVLIDGWLHTGDVGEWQPNGSMKIIDRKKNIFKLSQGEYVAVENLENVYGSVTGIDSIWVYGNSFESFLVAVVDPNKQVLERWAEENGVPGDFNSLCENPKAKQNVLVELTWIGKEKKLKGFEFIKAVHLDPEPFDVERDLLTPTFKKKRPQLLKYYQVALLDSLKERKLMACHCCIGYAHYVERLLNRISNGFPVLLSVLKEEHDDVEMVRSALETLVSALTPIDQAKALKNEVQPTSINTDLLSREAESISLLLSLLLEEDFYRRYYTLQLLTVLLTNSPNSFVIQNEALLLLTYLTREAEKIQKILKTESIGIEATSKSDKKPIFYSWFCDNFYPYFAANEIYICSGWTYCYPVLPTTVGIGAARKLIPCAGKEICRVCRISIQLMNSMSFGYRAFCGSEFSDKVLDEQKYAIKISDEKVVDAQVQQLDQYLKKFDEELQCERESAATTGSAAQNLKNNVKATSGRGRCKTVLLKETMGFDPLISILKLRGSSYSFTQQK
ncbi:unnamed protein product [Camellia sinensis]